MEESKDQGRWRWPVAEIGGEREEAVSFQLSAVSQTEDYHSCPVSDRARTAIPALPEVLLHDELIAICRLLQ